MDRAMQPEKPTGTDLMIPTFRKELAEFNLSSLGSMPCNNDESSSCASRLLWSIHFYWASYFVLKAHC